MTRSILGWADGVYISTSNTILILDPVKRGVEKDAHIFISHAHADHTIGFLSPNLKYSTNETKDLYESMTGNQVKHFKTINLDETIKLDDIEVTAVNSGHMLGSAQFKITLPNTTIFYTGDLNCVHTLMTTPAEVERCDILIMEATFGFPSYIFPTREKTYADIIKWIGSTVKKEKIPFFRVYAAGKAQEIIKLINESTTLPVFSDRKVTKACIVYNNYHADLDNEHADIIPSHGESPFVYVTASKIPIIDRRLVEAKATGWALNWRRKGCFPLSGHADFRQLVRFVEAIGAQKVYIYTGISDPFLDVIRSKLNIEASVLPWIKQKRLVEFI